MATGNATYQDIANYTGFSKTTISRYFNRPETVTPENREKIRHALEVPSSGRISISAASTRITAPAALQPPELLYDCGCDV